MRPGTLLVIGLLLAVGAVVPAASVVASADGEEYHVLDCVFVDPWAHPPDVHTGPCTVPG